MLDRIANRRIRNLLRGALSANSLRTLQDTMKNLRRETPLSDAYAVYQFLESPLARDFPRVDPFPAQPNRMQQHSFFEDTSLAHELIAQKVRIENHKSKLCEFLKQAAALNNAFLDGNDEVLEHLIYKIPEEFGYSLFILRKFLSIKHGRKNSAGVEAAVQKYLSAYHIPKRDIIAVSYEDSIDSISPYPRVRKTFLKYAKQRNFNLGIRNLIYDYFSPMLTDQTMISNRLQAYGITSLIDATVFLVTRREEAVMHISREERVIFETAVPQEIISIFEEDFRDLEPLKFVENDDDEEKFFEYNFFRHTNAWSEFSNVRKYRYWVETTIGSRLNGFQSKKSTPPPSYELAVQSNTLMELAKSECITPLDIEQINPKNSGCLHRTIALLILIENDNADQLNGDDLLSLLDKTVDIAHLATPEEISGFFRKQNKDTLYSYLRNALLHDNEETGVSGHRLRKSLEDVIVKNFSGNIIEFVDYLYSNGKHVGNHCYHTCTESFLVQLYELFDSAHDVVEARAQLLEWYGDKTKDESLIDRAKSLRLDIKLSRVRDDIDDNRIYVDPMRFHQWASDNLTSELRSSIPLISDWPQLIIPLVDLTNPITIIQSPELKVAQLLNQAFAEFCSNKFYGVESYIGRRIRHGTFRGTMLPDVKSSVDDILRKYGEVEVDACKKLSAWLKEYEDFIKHIDTNMLRVKSDSKNSGYIVPSISENNKFSTAKICIDFLTAALQGENPVPTAIASIPEYCWLLLEVDLRRLRNELQKIRDEQLIIDTTNILLKCSESNIGPILEACRYLNETVSRKFSTLSLWLTKPSNISPTATLTLLFNAVLVEVKEQRPEFHPEILESGFIDFDLFGHRYHYFYDILYILVHNAAKHGKNDGDLCFSASRQKLAEGIDIFAVSISSEIIDDASIDTVKNEIDRAMQADIENALVTEGFSGLRKVRNLITQLDELSDFAWELEGRRVVFTIYLTIPST